jgi:DNA mismatch endonuclease (patch repair protein)
MDIFDAQKRSNIMSRIKQKNTTAERLLFKALRKRNIYFTRNRKDVFGTPDVAFKRKKVAVFVDSDFWHGRKKLPKSNQEFWAWKFERNRKRDEEVNIKLKEQGWTVLRFGEDELKKNVETCIETIFSAIGKESVLNYKSNKF